MITPRTALVNGTYYNVEIDCVVIVRSPYSSEVKRTFRIRVSPLRRWARAFEIAMSKAWAVNGCLSTLFESEASTALTRSQSAMTYTSTVGTRSYCELLGFRR